MANYVCIDKIRDHYNRITSYILGNFGSGEILEVESDRLKQLMTKHPNVVENLKLTYDNRIINTNFDADYALLNRDIIIKTTQLLNIKTQYYNLEFEVNFDNEKFDKLISKSNILGIQYNYAQLNPVILIIEMNKTIKICTVKSKFKVVDATFLFSDISFRMIKIRKDTIDFSSVENISNMFYECDTKVIDISGIDTSNVKDAHALFEYSNAETIIMKDLNLNKVKSLKDAFNRCEKAKMIDMSGIKTNNLATTKGMFVCCNADIVGLKDLNTSKVTDMSWMFAQNKREILDLKSLDTSNLQIAEKMFNQSRFNILDISSFKTSKIVSTSAMFQRCTIVSELKLPKFDTSSLEKCDCMFERCITPIIDLSEAKFSDIKSTSKMFEACIASKINIRNMKIKRIAIIYNETMFKDCTANIIVKDNSLKRALANYKGGKVL